MEEETPKTITYDLTCPVCGNVRDDESAARCTHCGADLSTTMNLEMFIQSILLEARNDIRERKYSDAKIKLDIVSSMDQRNKLIAKLIGVEIDENRHNYEAALSAYEEIRDSGINASKWGIDLDSKIDSIKNLLEIECAAKERYNLALHRSREGFYLEAREELNKAADLAPYMAEIFQLAAKVDLALGDKDAAQDDITRFRQLRPDDPQGFRMQMELERRTYEKRIQIDQILFIAGLIVFAFVVIIILIVK